MMSKIYLSYNCQAENIELPVLPKKIEVKESGNNKSHTLQNIGEVTVMNTIKAPKLKIESVFPLHYGPYVTSRILKSPIEYINILKRWRDGTKDNNYRKQPIRLVVEDAAFPLNWTCTIENLTYKETSGAVGDIGYSIELKEYRWYVVKKAIISSIEPQTVTLKTSRPSEREIPKSYTVKADDTLYTICKRQLADGSKYKEVASKNGIKNPNLIYVGQVLKL